MWGEYILKESIRQQNVMQKSQNFISSLWSTFFQANNKKKLFQTAYLCLLVILLFGIVVYDDDFTNDDPPCSLEQSWIDLIRHIIEKRSITFFKETGNVSRIDKSNLISRAPPA